MSKLESMHTPGLKELSCGCVAEISKHATVAILHMVCPKLRFLACECDPDYLGDVIDDHVYEGVMGD